ncbi:MAG: electron transfer flavoprotein subunit beta/FixA family protein [Ignavibacteriae bacterium]|nr:electron transfer flavoprotein subunit beta/FixA family protein [Ignavibacteriota bacterium]
MNILVCVSQVPDTTTKVTVGADGKTIEKAGVKFILNPYDEFTIEEGLRLREKFGGSVTALTVGGDGAKEILRTALAMGVDKAIIVKDDNREDSFSVATNIAEAAKSVQPDVVILGRQSIDYDSFGMASMVGELLDMPSISVVSKWSIEGNAVTAERDIEGGKEVVETTLPCVISAQKGLNDPRYPKLPDIMKAKSKPIEERAGVASASRTQTISMELPQSKRVGKILGDSDADISELVRLLHEDAKVI